MRSSRHLIWLVAALWLVTACSSSDGETVSSGSTPDETTSTSASSGGSTTTPEPTITTNDDAVSFSQVIQPILEDNCASCHTPTGPGAAHLELVTAADAQRDALAIAGVAVIQYMPPWPAGDGDVAFHDDRRLDPDEIDAIQTWFDEGGEIDVDPTTPIEASRVVVPPLEGDVTMPGAPYKGSSANDIDDYRCQLHDPELTEPAFLQRYSFEADRTEVVHHALVFHSPAASRATYEALDAADDAAGWPCSGAGVVANRDGSSQIMSWAPGQAPTDLPADTGIEMEPGDFFVVQVHYHYEPVWDSLAPDESRLIADFADEADIAAAGGVLDPIDLELYLGPAEIPCTTEEVGELCDRSASVAEVTARSGPGAALIADSLNRRCGLDPATMEPNPEGLSSSTCDLPARPGEIVSVWAHMHEIGSWYRMTLNPDTPDAVVLLEIPTWSFDWQLNYEPIESIVLEDGDTIRVECGWDATLRDPDAPPRYVIWADGTDDEMCYSQIVTRPAPSTTS